MIARIVNQGEERPSFMVVTHWFDELQARLPVK
jgi:hypothetical protein